MKFHEWLHTRDNAPDNDPNNPSKAKFLRLRLDIMDYVDELEGMGVPSEEAKEKTTIAFKDEIETLPQEYQKQLISFIKFVSGSTYRN